MSRRRQASKRPLSKDGKYQSALVSRLVNTVMISGKKSTAQRIVYGAFDQLSEKNPASSPIEILQRAVDNAKPRIETKARRVGGPRIKCRSKFLLIVRPLWPCAGSWILRMPAKVSR